MGKEYDLRDRTMRFALQVCRLCRLFPDSYEGHHLAANYRAACRARSKPDFIAKLGTAIEEGDEADFWMESQRRPDHSDEESNLPCGRQTN